MSIDQQIVLVATITSLLSAFVAYWKGYSKGRREVFGLTGYWRERAEKAERRVRLLDHRMDAIKTHAQRIGLSDAEAIAFDDLQRRFNQ